MITTLTIPNFKQTGRMKLKNGETMNYGSHYEENGYFYFYTGKGLREIFTEKRPELYKMMLDKKYEELVLTGHYAKILLNDIEEFIS